MKKLLFILTIFLTSGTCYANEIAPVDTSSHLVITSRFYYLTKDTSLVIWLGSKWDTIKLAQPGDTVKINDFFTNWKALQYRKLNNHDSLSTLDEKAYTSLTGKPDLTIYKEKSDSLTNPGFYTNYKASLNVNILPNDTWFRVYDYAGNITNGWKKSKDNIFEFAGILGINSFYHVLNPGMNNIVQIPVDANSAVGTEHGVNMVIGGNKVLKVSAKSNGSGGVDTTRLTTSPGTMLGFGKDAKASVDIEAGNATRAPIQLASGDTLGISKAGAIGFNGSTYYGYNTARKQFAFLQDPHFKDTVTTPNLQVTSGWALGSLLIGAVPHRYIPSTFGQGVLVTSATGAVTSIPHGTVGKFFQSNGPTSDPSWVVVTTNSGDFLDAVIGMQVDTTLNPTLTNGYRYIILASSALNTNFGTINKDLAGGALTLGDGDIVQYVTASSEFRIAYDASAAVSPATVTVATDKNGASNHDWTYSVTADVWVDRGTATLHNSLGDLNTGSGKYYHITQTQDASGVLIKSDTTSLIATKTNIALYRLISDTTANPGTATVYDVSQKRALNNHDSLSVLDEKSYNSLTDKPTLSIYRLNNDHDSLSTLQEKNYSSLDGKPDLTVYTVKNDSSKLYKLKADSLTNSGYFTIFDALQKRSLNNHDSLSMLDEKAYASLTGKPDLTVYRLNNDHDSLSTLAEKNYSSLDGKPDLTVYVLKNDSSKLYKFRNDSILNSGYFTNYKASIGSGFSLLNDQWLIAKDYAGNSVNLLKISKDNLLEFAPKVGINQFYFVQNPGVNSIVDIPVNADSPDNTEHGTKITIGGQQALKISALSDGAGSVDSIRIEAQSLKLTGGAGYRKVPMSKSSLGLLKYTTAAYPDTIFANRLVAGTSSNIMGQLPLGSNRQILMSITDSIPKWKVPTTYDITPTGNRFYITPADTIQLDNLVGNLALKLDTTKATYVMRANWDKWNQWDGGSTGLVATTGRTSLGGTTVGQNLFTLTNPTAVTFLRVNADNTISALDAPTFRTAIGAGTSSTTGTVTSVGGIGTVSGLTLSGTVTTSGNLTLGGTLVVTPSDFASQTTNTFLAAPAGAAGLPTFRSIVATDIPILNQNTTGSAGSTVAAVTFSNSGTGAASGISFNGSTAQTISYNTIGAQVAGSYADLSHVHGNITNAGYIGVTAAIPLITGTGGIIQAGAFGSTAGTFAAGDDSRLSDSRPASDVYAWAKAATKPSYTYSEITSTPAINDATLTLNTAGSGISGSQTFTANQGTAATFTVTSNATTANTASTIVLRDASGNVSLSGDICTSSDSTLKKNIRPFNQYDFQRASKIDLLKFNYKKDALTDPDKFGGIAQEIKKYIPEVVSTSEETGKLQVDYIQLYAILLAQQKNEIDSLKDKIQSLERIVNKLEMDNTEKSQIIKRLVDNYKTTIYP